jgi:hypothetical protein
MMAKQKDSGFKDLNMLRADSIDTSDHDDFEDIRDNKGKLSLMPTSSFALSIKQKKDKEYDTLEKRLKRIADERKQSEDLLEKASKKEAASAFKDQKKTGKKKKENIIKMMFNDRDEEEKNKSDDDDDKTYVDKRRLKKGKKNRVVAVKDTAGTTIESKLGQRFSPMLQQYLDIVEELDDIAEEIKQDLEVSKAKNQYRASQVSNLISLKTNKMRAISDMTSMAKTISDLELKYSKEQKGKEDDESSSKRVTKFGVAVLQGVYDDEFEKIAGKKKKKKKDRDDDDDDDTDFDDDEVREERKRASDKMALKLTQGDYGFKFNKHQKNIDIEGKYSIAIVTDNEDDPEDDYKFIILDKHGERRKDWEKDRSELMPKKKDVKLKFYIDKLKAIDKFTGTSYKIIVR